MVKTVKNIYYMLSYAYQTLNEAGYKSIQSENFKNIQDLMAAILIKGVSNQIKRGLHRDYVDQTETIGNLRGKINITNSVKQQTMLLHRMVCHYDLFSEDTLLNQILKITMLLLLRSGDVKQDNRKALRKLLLFFENVSGIDPFNVNWSACRYHRNNASYKMLINICWLVIKGLLMTTENGEYKLTQFLDDQQMHRLYEKFVLGYFKREYPQYSISASYIDWNVDDGIIDFLPVMKSDITLTNGSKTLIIDTKYYSHAMQTNMIFDSRSIISGNLYQIYTYVKNKDRTGSGNVSGILLYAKTDEDITPDHDYLMGGNRISVKTLDLSNDWSEIENQLASIASLLEI
ncbi:MAG: 5-methylcytosine-specific restriction endonuclease system specificity protein McrC [Negativicutes bacterium]